MRTVFIFVAGLVAGAAAVGPSLAQVGRTHGLSHVGIAVANYDEAIAFYTGVLGLREAYTIRRPDGDPLLTYLQLNRDTFIELIPAQPGQTPGITHLGIEVGDIDAEIAAIRASGTDVADPGLTPANARFVRMTDREGVQIEVMELGPESLQRKAMDAWR